MHHTDGPEAHSVEAISCERASNELMLFFIALLVVGVHKEKPKM